MHTQIDITEFCNWAYKQVVSGGNPYRSYKSNSKEVILEERLIMLMFLAARGTTLTRTYYGQKQFFSTPHNRWINA